MIDPIHSLAFSIQANRGVYAVLVGSGISRAAKIPTGWEITLDLIRKLAVLHEEVCDPNPENWYRDKFDSEPDYSKLLGALAKTPDERKQLLRAYWEPTSGEHEEAEKQPTAAHRAIATLMTRGFVRVVVTTNFDRLMETALREKGVEPTVLSTPEQVAGAIPLSHISCCVFKVHGDYLDTQIRNTRTELDQYPPEFDRLLDRILDEFGLIVCGWSAEWDSALRKAFLRAPSRRFTTYWAMRGDPEDEAKKLIDHRGAQVIRIESADSFFQDIQQNVESIEEFSRPHPLSTEAAVASLKRYLSDNRHRIQLTDLIDDEVARVIDSISREAFPVQGKVAARIDGNSITARVRGYEAACSTLLAMASVGGFWAEEEQYHVWQRALSRLYPSGPHGGQLIWRYLEKYPATLFFYALGLGAMEADRLKFIGNLFQTIVCRKDNNEKSALTMLPPYCMFNGQIDPMRALEGMDKRCFPLNDWLYSALRDTMRRIVPDDEEYSLIFNEFEILITLAFAYMEEESPECYWAPPGRYMRDRQNCEGILGKIKKSLEEQGNESPFVESGLFGNSAEDCISGLS